MTDYLLRLVYVFMVLHLRAMIIHRSFGGLQMLVLLHLLRKRIIERPVQVSFLILLLGRLHLLVQSCVEGLSRQVGVQTLLAVTI